MSNNASTDETVGLTLQGTEQAAQVGPGVRVLLQELDQLRSMDTDEDSVERNMTVQFNVYQHAQLERLAEYFKQSKTSLASDLLKATIGDVFSALELPELTVPELRDFLQRTSKKKEAA